MFLYQRQSLGKDLDFIYVKRMEFNPKNELIKSYSLVSNGGVYKSNYRYNAQRKVDQISNNKPIEPINEDSIRKQIKDITSKEKLMQFSVIRKLDASPDTSIWATVDYDKHNNIIRYFGYRYEYDRKNRLLKSKYNIGGTVHVSEYKYGKSPVFVKSRNQFVATRWEAYTTDQNGENKHISSVANYKYDLKKRLIEYRLIDYTHWIESGIPPVQVDKYKYFGDRLIEVTTTVNGFASSMKNFIYNERGLIEKIVTQTPKDTSAKIYDYEYYPL